jgi:hypothetical protein
LTKHLCNPLRDLSLVQCLLLDDACSTQKKSCVRIQAECKGYQVMVSTRNVVGKRNWPIRVLEQPAPCSVMKQVVLENVLPKKREENGDLQGDAVSSDRLASPTNPPADNRHYLHM